jgi:hypothetical protein
MGREVIHRSKVGKRQAELELSHFGPANQPGLPGGSNQLVGDALCLASHLSEVIDEPSGEVVWESSRSLVGGIGHGPEEGDGQEGLSSGCGGIRFRTAQEDPSASLGQLQAGPPAGHHAEQAGAGDTAQIGTVVGPAVPQGWGQDVWSDCAPRRVGQSGHLDRRGQVIAN